MSRRRRSILAALFVASLLALGAALPAGGASWSQSGGGPGRSGHQPVDAGGLPARLEWARSDGTDGIIRTSVLTTGGPAGAERVLYGTDDGRLHVRRLADGERAGPAPDLSAGANPFGGGSASVTPVETSTASSLGQVFAVVNERVAPVAPGAVEQTSLRLAQVDEADAGLVRNEAIAGSTDTIIESSPVLSPPDETGARSLFFVTRQTVGSVAQLWKITIGDPTRRGAVVSAPESTGDIRANSRASPTIVWLNDASGVPTAYVAVATRGGLMTFTVSDLSPGPSSSAVGERVRAVTTPVTPTGASPGQPGSGVAVTPAIHVLAEAGAGTVVHRLMQDGNRMVLTLAASSAVLAGQPADGLSTSSIVTAAGSTPGFLFVGTSENLYSLRDRDLSVAGAVPGSYRHTVPVVTGEVVAVSDDRGAQRVFDTSTGSLVAADPGSFAPHPSNATASVSYGQPSLSRRVLVFASDRGVFAHRLRRAEPPSGYWLVASDGGIFAFGDAGFFGSTGAIVLNEPIVAMAPTPSGGGYWLVASDGGIFAFGDAGFFGSTGAIALNEPIVAMAPTPSGEGYWLVASDGGIFAFGDAGFFGSTGDIRLNQPIAGMAPSIDGGGYWLVARDGGIFAFGSAPFQGSTGDIRLNQPIAGMAAEPAGRGYWLVATDGGIFSFGGSRFFGSTGDLDLNSPIVAMAPSASGLGYLFTAADGGVFTFGDAPFLGSAAALRGLNRPVVGLAIKP